MLIINYSGFFLFYFKIFLEWLAFHGSNDRCEVKSFFTLIITFLMIFLYILNLFYFILFYFILFYHSTLSLLGIKLHNFFLFVFYGVFLSHVSHHDFYRLAVLTRVIFLIIFPKLHPSTLNWLGIEIHNYFFYLISKELSWSYNPGSEFCKLTWLTWVFLCYFLIKYFFKKISSFNIDLIDN